LAPDRLRERADGSKGAQAGEVPAFGSTLSRGWVGLVVLGLMLFGMAARGGLRRARRMLVPLGMGLERYSILGDDDTARRLHADLTRAPGAPFAVTELIPEPGRPSGSPGGPTDHVISTKCGQRPPGRALPWR
jgi:hypothetical protein